ncbi:hypothetical protein JRO89_XS14G0145900 [Xanthoceras sorbifolium]|uniref:Protein LNK2 n=1 Tax=Xanthoceras sorbifolium TaxID=99658 RepID=A0ABQ8H5C9_9ROSI|nr:hypothetical protein JRO89_XS14G0145900 [Xanthoceras sorbifolium]
MMMLDTIYLQLTDIIWGEAGEADDHIVPYQEGNENYGNNKAWSQEPASIKPTERKATGAKIDFNGKKLESVSNFNSNERNSPSGFGMDSWSDLSLSNAAQADQDSMGTEVTDNVAEITKFCSPSGVKAELDKDPKIFQNPDEGKDEGDFVDYSWDNIGSFDDLDRIFRYAPISESFFLYLTEASSQSSPHEKTCNDDPIFGHVNLGNADELWSSSKDVSNSPVKSFPLSAESPSLELGALESISDHVEVKSEFEQDVLSLTISHEKLNNSTLDLQNAHAILDHAESPGGKIKPIVKEQIDLDVGRNASTLDSGLVVENVATPDNYADKGYRQKNLVKGRKKSEEKNEGKLLQDMYGTWSPTGKYENQQAHSMLQSSVSPVLSQQRQLDKSETLQYQQISGSFVTPSAYGNLTNPYPAMPVLAHVQSGEFKNQPLLSGYEVSPGKANPANKSAAAPTKPLTMTPQEKIEKLRRRQQMQAMLAIQKQQLQLNHQISPRDHCRPPKFLENQIQHVEGADFEVEDLSTLPSFDPNSPIEQDDSNTSYLAVDNSSAEDTILYRLQDVIAKLDVRIRLCIRDSLFRLAQSAMQRHYASDTISTDKSSWDEPEVIAKAEANSSSRYTRMPDEETETNPIDRTVAHLLFHRPLELSGKHTETPDSPASSKFPYDRGAMRLLNFPTASMPEGSKIMFSHQGSKDPCPLPEPQHVDQFKTSSCLDTSENASNCGTADSGGAAEVEASQ